MSGANSNVTAEDLGAKGMAGAPEEGTEGTQGAEAKWDDVYERLQEIGRAASRLDNALGWIEKQQRGPSAEFVREEAASRFRVVVVLIIVALAISGFVFGMVLRMPGLIEERAVERALAVVQENGTDATNETNAPKVAAPVADSALWIAAYEAGRRDAAWQAYRKLPTVTVIEHPDGRVQLVRVEEEFTKTVELREAQAAGDATAGPLFDDGASANGNKGTKGTKATKGAN